MLIYAAPPQSPWGMEEVTVLDSSGSSSSAAATISEWVGWISWIGIVLSGLALMGFAVMLALDKERGRAISATAPHMELVKIALGVLLISSAGALGSMFFNSILT